MELLDIMNERFSVRKYVDGSLTVEYQEKYLQVL